ncbi:MAG: glycosyl transferase family 36 [Ignavibacteriaceae bacterium]|jgi:cellobiose phosphorylase|nr:glycosyl transferase family 36 [Ignavibacteriaceae bacterium]
MKSFSTKYGNFTPDGNEYIIKTPFTPKPWINVISNGEYGLVLSQTGGGFSWLTHSEFNRLNRWHQDLIQDNWGKYFYIKDNKTGDVWSPTWNIVKTPLDFYEARYGFGYAVFCSEYKGVKITLTIFVPMNESLEVWDFKIENSREKNIDLSIFSYFEWCLGSSEDFHREFHKTFIETEFDEKTNAMIGTKRLWEIPLGDRGHWNIEYNYFGFIASNRTISDYEGDKESFIGQNNTLQNPQGIRNGKLTKKTGKWNDSIGTIKIDLAINSKSSQQAAFYFGLKENKEEIKTSIEKFNTKEKIADSLAEVKTFWEIYLGTLEIDTPDDAMNLAVNKWFRYQAIAGRLWARTAYYQQSGAFGFRDQLQDSLVYLAIDPAYTEKQIRLHAKHQFEDGAVLHWWHPITETGRRTNMTDDLLWLPYIITHYIEETGNYEILKANEPYYNSEKEGSLLEHSLKAFDKVLTRLSDRGLTLIGAGDWNDGLSAVGLDWKGESIWLTEFFYLTLKRFVAVLNAINENDKSKYYNGKADELKEAFNFYAWDGEWYWGATKDSGTKIGSKENQDAFIWLNPQTWSVISGIAPIEKQKQAMDSVGKYLLKKNGALLHFPAYKIPDKHIGYLSRYAPGKRENGGVYSHAATWAVWAYASIKNSTMAYEAYKRLNPIYSGMNPDEYVAEPFVTPGNIDGPDSPNYGMGGWTWYTGSASWFVKVAVDWILGVRATQDGLLIDPCIPKEWNSFSVKRVFRNCTYHIKVNNDGHVSDGVEKILVDGIEQTSNLVLPQNKKECDVVVYLKNNK